MKKRVYTDIDAALLLAEPTGFRNPMEKPKDIALRILVKYNEAYGRPDMRKVSGFSDAEIARLLSACVEVFGQLDSNQFV